MVFGFYGTIDDASGIPHDDVPLKKVEKTMAKD